MNLINNILNNITSEFNYQITNFNLKDIIDLSELICTKNLNNKVFFTGIGKSENMAYHCSDLLKSIGINSFNLNTSKALHGDIGTIKSNDLVIFYSNSGNTLELLPLIEHLTVKNIITVGICCNKNCKFKDICSKTLILPLNNELNINGISSVPTNSIMSQLIFINLLISYTINYLNLDIINYKYNHPAGNIGKNLKTIKDCIIKEFPKLILKEEFNLNEILIVMTKYSYGFCCFTNENNELYAVISDGDIRRIMINNNDNKISKNKLNYNYYSITDQNILISTINKRYKYIPIIDEHNILQGLVKL